MKNAIATLVLLALGCNAEPGATSLLPPGGSGAAGGAGGMGGAAGASGDGGAGGAGGAEPLPTLRMSGKRIKQRIGTTDDGARDFIGWWDDDLKAPCVFEVAADGKTRCLPTAGLAWVIGYTDETCTAKVGQPAKECGKPSYVGEETASAVCEGERGVAFREVGAPFEGKLWEVLASGACDWTKMIKAGDNAWVAGPDVKAEAFVERVESVE